MRAAWFIGGTGAIDLPKRMREGVARFSTGANFLIRIREKIAGADIADAIVDAPSDRLPNGMTDEFRSSEQHASDDAMRQSVTERQTLYEFRDLARFSQRRRCTTRFHCISASPSARTLISL